MNFNQLRSFLAVAQYRSFTKAADELYLVQSTVSHGIKELEKELQLQLFVRDKGFVTLTEQGEALLPMARDALAAADAMSRYAENNSRGTRELRIAYDFKSNIEQIRESVLNFQRVNVRYQVQLTSMGCADICNALLSGEIDTAVCTLPADCPEDLEYMELQQRPLYILTVKENAAGIRQQGGIPTFMDRPLILKSRESDPELFNLVMSAFPMTGLTKPAYIEAEDLYAVELQVEINKGWCICPQNEYVRSAGRLVYVPTGLKSLQQHIGLLWKKNHRTIRPFLQYMHSLKLEQEAGNSDHFMTDG